MPSVGNATAPLPGTHPLPPGSADSRFGGETADRLKVRPEALAGLVELVANGEINQATGREVLTEMSESGRSAAEIVAARGLKQVSDTGFIAEIVRQTLEEKSTDGVLVIDGGGSHRCALLGGNLSRLACDNGWAGIIVYGCIRDSVEISALPIGIRALHTHPLKSHKRGTGDRDKQISFAGINFRTGFYAYADEDGIVVSDNKLV